MDQAEQALTELTDISSQIEAAVIFEGGKVVAATVPGKRAGRLAETASRLLEAAQKAHGGELTQLEAATGEGSVFVVRDGPLAIAAVTGLDSTAGLVFYDLKSCLRRAAEQPKAKRRAAPKRPKAKSSGSS